MRDASVDTFGGELALGVSLIVPAYNEEVGIVTSAQAMLSPALPPPRGRRRRRRQHRQHLRAAARRVRPRADPARRCPQDIPVRARILERARPAGRSHPARRGAQDELGALGGHQRRRQRRRRAARRDHRRRLDPRARRARCASPSRSPTTRPGWWPPAAPSGRSTAAGSSRAASSSSPMPEAVAGPHPGRRVPPRLPARSHRLVPLRHADPHQRGVRACSAATSSSRSVGSTRTASARTSSWCCASTAG